MRKEILQMTDVMNEPRSGIGLDIGLKDEGWGGGVEQKRMMVSESEQV